MCNRLKTKFETGQYVTFKYIRGNCLGISFSFLDFPISFLWQPICPIYAVQDVFANKTHSAIRSICLVDSVPHLQQLIKLYLPRTNNIAAVELDQSVELEWVNNHKNFLLGCTHYNYEISLVMIISLVFETATSRWQSAYCYKTTLLYPSFSLERFCMTLSIDVTKKVSRTPTV